MIRLSRFRSLLVLAIAVTTAGCGGSSTGPSARIPSVNGSYSGTVTLAYPELQRSLTCPASTTVTQSGSTVNIAPILLGGQCGGLSIPIGQGSIDSTGALDGGSGSGTYTEASCGVYSYTVSGGFFGREFRASATYTSRTCYNFNFTMTLTR